MSPAFKPALSAGPAGVTPAPSVHGRSGAVSLAIAVATGGTSIQWSGKFVLAFIWLIAVLSVGAILLLLWLLNTGSAASVSSLFYLVPPATAVEAFFLFGEKVNTQGFLGMGVTALGVWLVISN
jgi:drug/metabolite transporter (DMT)-like permease